MSVYYCFSNFYQYYEKIKYQKFMKLVKKTKNKLKIKLCIEGGGRFYFQNGKNFMRKTCTVFVANTIYSIVIDRKECSLCLRC